jgi:hypothetical protein
MTLGVGIREGKTLYKDIHDNKPPGIYTVASLSPSIFVFRLITLVIVCLSVVGFWHLIKQIGVEEKWVQRISTIIFAIGMSIPLFEGNTPNAEQFFVCTTIFAFLFLTRKRITIKDIFIGGSIFALGVLFKIPTLMDIATIGIIWLLKEKDGIKKSILLGLAIIIPIAGSILWYTGRGAGEEYIKAAFLQNIGYVSSFRPSDKQKSFIEKNKPLIERTAIAGTSIVVLLLLRKQIPNPILFGSLWLTTSLFGVTLSERPYPHYMLQAVPAISLLLGIVAISQKKYQTYPILPLVVASFIPFYGKFYEYKTGYYYANFIQFALQPNSLNTYRQTFDKNVPRNYEIAKYIQTTASQNDSVVVWGDNPAIYALLKKTPPIKFVTRYHILDFSSVEDILNTFSNTKPTIFVTEENVKNDPKVDQWIKDHYNLVRKIQDAQIWIKNQN